MIRRLATGLLLLPLLLVFGCESDLPEGAIAQVGTQLISQSQFDSLKSAYEAAGRAPNKDRQPDDYHRFEQGLAEYLVMLEVVRQEAPAYEVTVTDQDVDEQMELVKRMFQGDDERLAEALEQQNLTLEELNQSIRDSLWIERMKAAVTGEVTVEEDEVKAYYQANRAEYVEQESREVRHILISPFKRLSDGTVSAKATEGEWEAARTEAEKVRTEIQNGADFITEVEKYSDDIATNEAGGDLGAIVRGQMTPAFEEAVFSLKKGELSEPVRTAYGYHIIEVTDITPEQQLAYDQVKESIRTALLTQKQSATWEEWLAGTEAELGVVYQKGYAPSSKTGFEADLQVTTTTTNE